MLKLYLKAISLIAPGLKDWQTAQQVLTQVNHYQHHPIDKKLSTLLPPNEHRRCTRTTQLALSAVQQLLEHYPLSSQTIRYIFSSCNGDLTIFHHISSALTHINRPVSPIKFHNSVHNAPAGYCSIVLQSQQASSSITGYKDSFICGLLDASVQSLSHQQDALLCGYDEIPPKALLSLYPITDDFSYALLLSPEKEQAICRLEIKITEEQTISTMKDATLEQLRQSNPQAKILPLLYAIANKQNALLYFNNNQQQIAIQVNEF
ncbi:MAG: beta-ketoacyl synthase chain length factor [Gammaproteobacteria bacterium]|nr:beta-ketoacyl synthase chain length factor [Gammaproteobacteria bacterium]